MVPYERKNLKFARENRKVRHATRHEGLLWHTYLKKCEVNFTRLYRIGNYILDFYAPSIRLAIEIDGGSVTMMPHCSTTKRELRFRTQMG